MSFFGSKLFGLSNNGIAGSSNGSSSSSISGAETIERLCDRVQSTLLIEDKKDSLNAIKSLSKKYKLEVGTQAMPILIDVLRQNKMDSELCCLALDTLFNIMNTVDDTEAQNLPADISTQFTEMFIKDTDNVALLFELLDEFEFQTRWSTVKLFNQLVVNLTSQLQEKILQIPSGVSRLMDLLNDSREVIRNDAILLMINLTKTNANIQKIIAFESGFDRIIEIIEGEGSVLNGGVIVEDCLNLLINLLQKNYSNQNFFKEANYIKIICKYFEINNGNTNGASSTSGGAGSSSKDNAIGGASSDTSVQNWSSQKSTNLSLLLKLIRCLVAPSNQHQIISDSQRAFSHFGLLIRLCALLTLPGVPADVLSEAIRTVGEVIRGNAANQQLFSSVMMQTNPPRPIITILLLSMINEKQPFHMRCSILYCFECFLYKNETKKTEIIETLLPKENQQPSQQVTNQINSGQILCNGLFTGTDSVSNWLCAVALAHTINENNHLKEQLLRVQLAINTSGNEIKAVSLMQQCMNILIQSTSNRSKGDQTVADQCRFQTTISILMLMSTWLVGCPTAVNQFLSEQQNIPYLISQASSTDTEEKSLLIQGVSSFLLGLNMLFNGNQIPAYTVDNLKDTIKKRIGIEQFEHKLEYISQHEEYTKTLKLTTFTFKSMKPNDLLFDYEFARLFKSNETLILNLLSKNGAGGEAVKADAAIDESRLEQHNAIIVQYQNFIREQDLKLKEQQQLNQMLSQTCSQLQEHCRQLNDRMSSMKQQATVSNEAINSEQAHLSEKLKFQARINELEVKVNLLEEKCSEQEDELCKLQREKGILQETINNLQTVDKSTELIEMKTQNQNLKKTNQQLNQEQENLLTLLSEMEIKMKNYKKLLKQHAETVSDDDDDDDEEEEEEEGERRSPDDLVENTKDVKLISSSNSNTDQHDRENKSEPFLKIASPVDASSSSSSSLLNKQVPDLLNENNKLDVTNVIHQLNPTNGESSGATTTSSTSSASSSSNSHSNQINPMNFFGQYPPDTQNFFTQPAHLTMFNLQQQQHQSEQPTFDQHHQQPANPFQNYFK